MVRGRAVGWALLLNLAGPLAAALPAGPIPELWVEQELEPREPYVQQQIIQTTRLYRRSSFLSGYFVAPEAEGFRTAFLDESPPRRVVVAGEEYERIDYRRALFPQRSGELTVPGVAYSGREVFARGEPRVVQVRPAVGGAEGGWWLPATAVALSQRWEYRPDTPRTGEILLRTLRVEAEGVTGAQLPTLTLPRGTAWRVQRLAARTGTEVGRKGVTGWREERWRVIPATSGRLSLPGVAVTWWDLQRDGLQRATLPAEVFVVAAGAAGAANTPSLPDNRQGSDAAPPLEGDRSGGLVMLAVVAPMLVLVLFGRWKRVWRSLRYWRAWREFQRACKRGSAAEAWRSLSAWSAQGAHGVRAASPLAAARALGIPELEEVFRHLDAALYRPVPEPWHGRELLAVVRRHRKALRRGIRANRFEAGLPPLNPTSTSTGS